MDHLFDMRPERPGYRLQRLEVLNWGTFDSTDGHVYRFEPEGRTSLLVGHNASGKSTLVDAILTLLVPSSIRNYNLAAGGKKTDRNERSYIRGAYGRSSDDSQHTVVKYLRPKGDHLSALAAVFRDEQLDRAFTVCQVLHLTADGTPDKVFAIADEPRELTRDLSGLTSSDGIRRHLQDRGYQTTKTFLDYHGWIAKRTKMRGKAMDMFNQTVAVKEIESLNAFIRRHMLEAHDWREKVERLLTHFNDLSVAHQELLRARNAEELLAPVEQLGTKYRAQRTALDESAQRLAAADAFFQTEIVRLFKPEILRYEEDLATTIDRKNRLGDELKTASETIRRLKNEIELAGGQRLRDIPVLIEREQAFLNAKREALERFRDNLRRCNIDDEVATAQSFAAVQRQLRSLTDDWLAQLPAAAAEQEASLAERGTLRQQLRDEQHERQILSERHTNLPSHLATMRARICEDLELSEATLPFVGELIAVDPDERRWEASAEMVLRPFALSLLVPERFYRRVRTYVEETRLADGRGQGQRLVYLRVGKTEPSPTAGDRLHPHSLLRKLRFRTGHDLIPWVREQVLRRFDFRCCESIEEFNDTTRFAMTANRHIKTGDDRHEKDDRPRAVDPRHYVLGWDNREKLRRIDQQIAILQSELANLDRALAEQAQSLDLLREQQAAAATALQIHDFDAIDVHRHQHEIHALEREKLELETSNTAVKALRKRLLQAESDEVALRNERDECLKQEQSLSDHLKTAKQLVANAHRVIEKSKADGSYDTHAPIFDAIRGSLGEPSLTSANVFERQQQWTDDTKRQIEKVRSAIEPLAERLLEAMNRFLREFKEEQADLNASLTALDSFLSLLEHLRQEDLPRHEKKFKDRLNDKVTQEVALLSGALRQESRHIEGKIEQLNVALAQLEYRPGTFMRLEPREVIDKEIADFRRSLRECLDESLENTDEAHEARFVRIQKLVERLADKDNTRWRDKVVDVRHWYDFAAREVEKESGETRSFYEDSAGQSGGEKAKLAFTILVAAIAYQYDLDPTGKSAGRFHFVVVDEMFSKVDDQNAEYALKLFEQFGLQLLIVAPLDSKARITEPFVDCYLHVVKDETTNRSQLYSMSAREYEEVVKSFSGNGDAAKPRRAAAK